MPAKSVNFYRVVLKVCIILLIINFAFPLISFIPLNKLSLYNTVFPGRQRLPFGETPELAYNLTLNDMDAMIASHEVTGSENQSEFSIFLVGDSSVWGTLLTNEATISSKLEATFNSERNISVNVYNLGYPTISVLKDLVILDKVMGYEPDVVIWFVTLNALTQDAYLDTPLLLNNPEMTNSVIQKYQLDDPLLAPRTYWEKTFINQRRNIYDRIHLQLLANMWASTGIDQYIPDEYTPATRDFERDDSFFEFEDQVLTANDLDLDVIHNFIQQNLDTQVLIVNEPILVSQGENSDIRYNYYYPCWAYDQYRELLAVNFEQMGIKYIDFWDVIPQELFTNSAIHYDAQGVEILVEKLYMEITKDVANIE